MENKIIEYEYKTKTVLINIWNTNKEEKTGEITLMGCMFNEDGDYTLKIELLNSDYKILGSDTEIFSVNYWGQFEF